MAMEPRVQIEMPHNQLVASYSVLNRDRNDPVIACTVIQVCRVMEDPVLVDAVDGDTVTITAWAGRGDVMGRSLWKDEDQLGVIVGWDEVEAIATIDGPLPEVGDEVAIQQLNTVNAPMYRAAEGHRDRNFSVQGDTEEGMTYIRQRMFNCMMNVTNAILEELGVEKSPAEVQAAVYAMAIRGISIDSFMTWEAETLASDVDLPFVHEM